MEDPMAHLEPLYEAILAGDDKTALVLTRTALADAVDPQRLVADCMIPAMDEVGRRFEAKEYFVPELLISARAMKTALGLIRPLLAERGAKPIGRVVIGTVKGDLHDIGKGLVASMLEGAGFEVIDLGVDVSAEKFVEQAKENGADIVAMSALLTTTMTNMKSVIEALTAANLRPIVKVTIGGAPVTQQYADQIRADGYSSNANGAVFLARRLVQPRAALTA
jgi:corrinoid protein of di/trimethylamine methyltransferase